MSNITQDFPFVLSLISSLVLKRAQPEAIIVLIKFPYEILTNCLQDPFTKFEGVTYARRRLDAFLTLHTFACKLAGKNIYKCMEN